MNQAQNIQRLVLEKRKHMKFLEIEVTKLWNLPQTNQAQAKLSADLMLADIHRIAAEIIDLKNGFQSHIKDSVFSAYVSKYYQSKLKQETEHATRCDIIHTANWWTLLMRKFKKEGK